MGKLDALFDRALMSVVTRASGRSVGTLAAISYLGIGLILPIGFQWTVPWLVSANLVGTTIAAGLVLGWLDERILAANRHHLMEWTSNLRLLTAGEFEWLVGELFRREGWTVQETGRFDGPDGNIDLVLTQPRRRVVVQCKRWQSKLVGVDEIRVFAGTLMREGLAGTGGIFVTLSDFTSQAREEARQLGISLVGNADLLARIEKVRKAEPCPICHAPMALGRSERGWWFRCAANGCRGKRDLSGDPGRAIELLTQST